MASSSACGRPAPVLQQKGRFDVQPRLAAPRGPPTAAGRERPPLGLADEAQPLGFQPAFPERAAAGPSAAPACGPDRSCRPTAADRLPPTDLLQRAADLCTGTLPGAFRRQGAAAGGVVGGIAHHQVKAAGGAAGNGSAADPRGGGKDGRSGSFRLRPAPPGGQRIPAAPRR